MTCKRCESDPQPPGFVSPRKCAFGADGSFVSNNWNCATLEPLRERVADGSGNAALWNEDQWVGAVRFGSSGFIVLGWYKSRGRTEVALVIDGEESHPLTLTAAELFIAATETP